jgi:transcriptional regulator with XRE-family HTH domain
VKSLRLESEKRLKDVSDLTGIAISSLSRIESNEVQPDASDVNAFCRIFGVAHKWLCTGSGMKYEADGEKPDEGLAGLANELAQALRSAGLADEYILSSDEGREKIISDVKSLIAAYRQIMRRH